MASENYPVIVGVGQLTIKEKIDNAPYAVIDLMTAAIDTCVADTGQPDILQHIDCISMVNSFTVDFDHPVKKLCERIGVNPGIIEETAIGGNNPQWLVNRAADSISKKKFKAALLLGGEALYLKEKKIPLFDIQGMTNRLKNDPLTIGDFREGATSYDRFYQLHVARYVYPLFENALRHALGLDMEGHKRLLKTYFSNMEQVSKTSPYAWYKDGIKTGDVTEESENNRMICFPYTKFMNPSMTVNQAAALIITDTDTARSLSVPEEKWVYVHGGAEATDKWFVSERVSYHSSPAIRETVQASLQMAGMRLEDIHFFDLYSCFPCAALIAARSLGLPLEDLPPLSVTGGLPYFGGPGNNYTMHAIAHTVERLREIPEQVGLVTGVGWFLTKHAAGIYSGMLPKYPWERPPGELIQKKIDSMESPVFIKNARGDATVETYTVIHDEKGDPFFPVIVARLDSGERCFATTKDEPSLVNAMEQEEFIGKKGRIQPGENTPNIICFD